VGLWNIFFLEAKRLQKQQFRLVARLKDELGLITPDQPLKIRGRLWVERLYPLGGGLFL
jgi:hypothetical protein